MCSSSCNTESFQEGNSEYLLYTHTHTHTHWRVEPQVTLLFFSSHERELERAGGRENKIWSQCWIEALQTWIKREWNKRRNARQRNYQNPFEFRQFYPACIVLVLKRWYMSKSGHLTAIENLHLGFLSPIFKFLD